MIFNGNSKILERYNLPSGKNSLLKYLISKFPNNIKEIRLFLRLIKRLGKEVTSIINASLSGISLNSFFDCIKALTLLNYEKNKFCKILAGICFNNFLKYNNLPYNELLTLFNSKKLKSIFSTDFE